MGRKQGDFDDQIYVRVSKELKNKIKEIKDRAKEVKSKNFKTEADFIRHVLEKSTQTLSGNTGKGSRIRVYSPNDNAPFDLSRSAVDLFIDCPRCFVLHKKKGIARPSGFPFTLNNAVDTLLKNEFDIYREQGKPHPIYQLNLTSKYGEQIDCIPYQHDDLKVWRNAFKGIQYEHPQFNFRLRGVIDDVWEDRNRKELIIVDYKATSTQELVMDKPWHDSFRKQLEFYQYLFRQNGFSISDTSYILYANAIKKLDGFNETLNFEVTLFNHEGQTDWVEDVLNDIKKTLDQDEIPPRSESCTYCKHSEKVSYLNLF